MTVEILNRPARIPASIGTPAPSSITPPREWWVETADSSSGLQNHLDGWNRLARNAVEANVFYEPWMFLPGLEKLQDNRRFLCALVFRRDTGSPLGRQLCGFFPFERSDSFKGLPISTLQLWSHRYNFLCTPLMHRQWPQETLNALWNWMEQDFGGSIHYWPTIHGEGPFHHALIDVLQQRRARTLVDSVHTRAMLRLAKNAQAHFEAIGSANRKKWRRQRRRLAEAGNLESLLLTKQGNVERWIEQFLQLEASGWKGQAGSALAARDTDRAYFQSITREAHARDQLNLRGLFLNDRPVAMQCDFLSGNGGFAFKVAYDETYAKCSPGVLLELDNIADLHERATTDWVDSCVDHGGHMIDRLWHHRRVIQSLVLATNRWPAALMVGALPLLRAIKSLWTR